MWSAGLGLLLDGMSSERLGLQMSFAAAIAWGLQLVKTNGRFRGGVATSGIAFVVVLLWRTLSPFVDSTLSGREVEPFVIVATASLEAGLTAGLALMIVMGDRLLLGGTRVQGDSNCRLGNRWRMLAE